MGFADWSSGKVISISSFISSIGILFLILACTKDDIWWPAFVLIPYMVLPITTILCQSVDDPMSQGVGGWSLIAHFFTGAILCSVLAIPLIQVHVEAISTYAFAFAFSSNIFILGGIYMYSKWNKENSSAMF